MNNKFSFVIMPFANEFTQAYTDIIQPAIKECSIDCIRADEDSQGNIHHQMMQKIFDADVIVTDITGLNPNVFYELGVAHTISRKTVVICNVEKMEKVPFDIAPYRILTYKLNQDNRIYIEKLKTEIKSILLNNLIGIPNPVQDYLSKQSLLNCRKSLFLNELRADLEQELFEKSEQKIVFFGLTANSFYDTISGIIETKKRQNELNIKLLLLDINAIECWEYIYRLRFGADYNAEMFGKYFNRDKINQENAIENFENLGKKYSTLKIEFKYYSFPPTFWAYGIDDEKWITGQYAVGRSNSRNFPISVLLHDDFTTQFLYNYYNETILSV